MTEERPDYLTAGEARELLQVSKPTFSRMLRDGRLVAYRDPRDKRLTLVRRADVARLLAGPQRVAPPGDPDP